MGKEREDYELEVTTEMIKAGLVEWSKFNEDFEKIENALERIFLAMYAIRQAGDSTHRMGCAMGDNSESEIDITPEMIEEGYHVLRDSGIADALLEADRLVVADIFRCMFQIYRQKDLGVRVLDIGRNTS